MRRTVETEWGELAIVMPQDRAVRLARQILRTLGPTAVDLIGAGVAVVARIDDDWTEMQTMMAIGAALTEAGGREQVLALVEMVSGDRIALLCASILDGSTLDGVRLVRQRPPAGWVADDPTADPDDLDRWHPLDSMAGAIGDTGGGWALHMLAMRVAREARLLPLPDGSAVSDTAEPETTASPSGPSAP